LLRYEIACSLAEQFLYYLVWEWARPTFLVVSMAVDRKEIEKLVAEVVIREGFEFVEMQLARHGRNHTLRVFADGTGGINLDQCTTLSKAIGRQLDTIDPFDAPYTLEVSSPGLDRPLTRKSDFTRRIGEKIRIQYIDEGGNSRQTEGVLKSVEGEILLLESGKGAFELPIEQVKRGKIVF
jgi:ribosome maturation factor RimP